MLPQSEKEKEEIEKVAAVPPLWHDQRILMPIFGDDELAFYLTPSEFPEFVQNVLETFLKHQKVFVIFMAT